MDASQPNAQNTDAASLGFIVLWCFIPPSFFWNVVLHSIDPVSIHNDRKYPCSKDSTKGDELFSSFSKLNLING